MAERESKILHRSASRRQFGVLTLGGTLTLVGCGAGEVSSEKDDPYYKQPTVVTVDAARRRNRDRDVLRIQNPDDVERQFAGVTVAEAQRALRAADSDLNEPPMILPFNPRGSNEVKIKDVVLPRPEVNSEYEFVGFEGLSEGTIVYAPIDGVLTNPAVDLKYGDHPIFSYTFFRDGYFHTLLAPRGSGGVDIFLGGLKKQGEEDLLARPEIPVELGTPLFALGRKDAVLPERDFPGKKRLMYGVHPYRGQNMSDVDQLIRNRDGKILFVQ